MSETLLYLDSSAIVKLIVPEPETAALLNLLADWPERISSALARVEVLRAIRRAPKDSHAPQRAEEVLARLGLLKVDEDVLRAAARLDPEALRSLDAIHLAAALSVEESLGAMVIYDSHLAEAATSHGLSVLAPGKLET